MNRRYLGFSLLVIVEVSCVAALTACGGSSAAMVDSPSMLPALPIAVTMSSPSPTVAISSVQQFSATLSAPIGSSSTAISQGVVWSVTGSGCSGASCGTIDASGKYTPPATVPDPATVMVTATSAVDAKWSGAVPVVIVAHAGESFSFAVSSSGIAFGSQTVNTTSAAKVVTLTNTGSTPQPVLGRINGSPGQWQNLTQTNDCPSKLAAGASCTFNITFTPSAAGSRSAMIFFDGIFDEEGAVNLAGTGVN